MKKIDWTFDDEELEPVEKKENFQNSAYDSDSFYWISNTENSWISSGTPGTDGIYGKFRYLEVQELDDLRSDGEPERLTKEEEKERIDYLNNWEKRRYNVMLKSRQIGKSYLSKKYYNEKK